MAYKMAGFVILGILSLKPLKFQGSIFLYLQLCLHYYNGIFMDGKWPQNPQNFKHFKKFVPVQ